LEDPDFTNIIALGLDSLNYLRAANRNVDDKFSKLINIVFTLTTITASVSGIMISIKLLNKTEIPKCLFYLIGTYFSIFLILVISLIKKISFKKGETALSFGEFVNQISTKRESNMYNAKIRTLQAISELIIKERDWNHRKTKYHFFINFLLVCLLLLSCFIILEIAII